jgi:hypothetical protein
MQRWGIKRQLARTVAWSTSISTGAYGIDAIWEGQPWIVKEFHRLTGRIGYDVAGTLWSPKKSLLRATIMIGHQVDDMISEGAQKIIFTDSHTALNRIQHNEPDPGQTWASAIMRSTEEICRQNIQLEFRWVPGHAGIEGNETADQLAKDAAVPGNEEELPSEEDRCTSLSHLRRCTTDAKWKRSDEWFEAKCKSKKYSTSISSTSQTGQSQKPKNRRRRFSIS